MSMTNSQIAAVFEKLADLLEFKSENPFRIRAYRNGARAIRDLTESAAAIAIDNPKRLTQVDGIGKAVAEKTEVLVNTGELPQLTKLLEEIPESVLALLRIPGLGPKKAVALYKELDIVTLDQLKAACEEGRVRELKGFAAKTEKAILEGLSIAAAANERIYWAAADEIVQQIRQHFFDFPGIEQFELAGSYRRGRETVGDLDILVVSADVSGVMDRLEDFSGVHSVIVRGDTKMSVRLDNSFQVDLRIVPPKSFGAALQYFTGSKDHNVVLRGMAKQHGLKINEYGVYRVSDDAEEYVAGATEEEVYGALGLPVFPPELRESRSEFQWAAAGGLPDLVQLSEIRGDLHMHTTATDGKASLDQMIDAARERGLDYIAITDHSQRVTMARGLTPERLLAQWQEIDAANARLGGEFTVLKGIECDILERGGLDLPDDILAQADWVLASIHYGQRQPREQITERILQALENPHVSAVAHPTGRLINHREAYEVDMDTVFTCAREHGKLLELNANPMRLDLDDVLCAAAKRHGISLCINTDAHGLDELGMMRFGILQARRAGLTKDDIANTRPWPEMQRLIGRRDSA